MATNVFCWLILILCAHKTSGATFENITLTLKYNARSRDATTLVITDDFLKRYVGDFGEVIIENQTIPELVKLSVSNFPKVTHLHLTNCKIRKIEPGSFQNIPLLIDLNLSENLLEEIEDGVFANLKFKTLYLENNRILRIGDQAFNNLQMEYLFIDNNRLSEWKSQWFDGTRLRSISMSNNLLRSFPRLAFEFLFHFNRDPVLVNLNLSNNKISYIHPDAFEGVKSIVTLNLQNNSLVSLEPGSFDTVETIDQIYLSNNKLTKIYYESFRNTKVNSINIFDNLVTCISTDVFRVTELKSLNVGKNPISCSCVRKWNVWIWKNDVPEVDGWAKLKKDCASVGVVVKSGFVLGILLVLIFI